MSIRDGEQSNRSISWVAFGIGLRVLIENVNRFGPFKGQPDQAQRSVDRYFRPLSQMITATVPPRSGPDNRSSAAATFAPAE